MNRNFLKEAIADAKAVKESAIANAKVALEETFTPQLKSMLARRLEEMENMDETEDVDEGYDEEVNEMAGMDDVMEEEMNLDEILAELDALNEEDPDEITEAKEDEEDEEDEEDKEAEEDKKETFDIEEMSEEDLIKFVEDVIKDMVEAGELEAGGDQSGEEGDEGDEDEIELDLDVEDDETKDPEITKEEYSDLDEEKEKMEEMKKDLREAYKAIKSLRSELQEVNLLNAKLLYTNKIFKSKSLNDAQKVKILETFDKATTVNEVKLVYETLSESLSTNNLKKKSISESIVGSASKSAGVISQAKRPIVEPNEMIARFQKLAGLK